jgi:hypothetical protein
MRRVHRFPASLQRPCPARQVRSNSSQAVHTQELPLTRNVSTTSESPRVVFSGIQPTGIPHVRRPCLFIRRDYAHPTLTTVSARKLLWRACELGQVTIYRRARRQALFLRCRLACPHTAAGSQDPLGSTDDYDGSHTCVWHRCPKSRRFPSGRGDCSGHVIYQVSYSRLEQVQNHAELAWILSCITPVGKLKRMTTWKVHWFVHDFLR